MSYTSQQFLPFDSGTFANFRTTCLAISQAFLLSGWVQQPDTGQVVWTASSVPISAVAVVGAVATYTYDATAATGPVLRVGMSVIITGFTTGANNVTATITALGGSGASSTFAVVKVSQANETHAATGVTTAIATVPSSTTVYEIWAPGDALQTGATAYYIRLGYGSTTGTTTFNLTWGIGSSTNGAGTLTGNTTGIKQWIPSTVASSNTNGFECDFSGDTDRIGIGMWRNFGNVSVQCLFTIERTKNSSGVNTSEGVTVWIISNVTPNQITLTFGGSGLATTFNSAIVAVLPGAQNISTSFAGTAIMYPVFPVYGKIGNPATVVGWAHDVGDGMLVTTTLYGSTRTYLVTSQWITGAGLPAGSFIAMRYD